MSSFELYSNPEPTPGLEPEYVTNLLEATDRTILSRYNGQETTLVDGLAETVSVFPANIKVTPTLERQFPLKADSASAEYHLSLQRAVREHDVIYGPVAKITLTRNTWKREDRGDQQTEALSYWVNLGSGEPEDFTVFKETSFNPKTAAQKLMIPSQRANYDESYDAQLYKLEPGIGVFRVYMEDLQEDAESGYVPPEQASAAEAEDLIDLIASLERI